MKTPDLIFDRVEVRPVVVPLRRPVISKVGGFEEWPLLLIDLHTTDGVVGRSYLEPYLTTSLGVLERAITEIAEPHQGKPMRPLDDFDEARKSQSSNSA